MTQKSAFLFDDQEQFFYGDFTHMLEEALDSNSVQIVKIERQERKPVFKHLTAALVGCALVLTAPVSGATAAHTYLKQKANVWEHKDPDLKSTFTEARKFLGLTQEKTAKIVGLSTSAIEKIEQGVYSSLAKNSREQLFNFIEWVSTLRAYHRDRKFIVRSIVNTKSELLGKVTPIEFAIQNPQTGLKDLIALERQISG